ncbi:MAG: type II secretion system protein E [Proteobacteria bacterium]|nr:MAG: type II secretion system protein E [Pseudomonadota bacterium]PIE40140.1 MAG: type II secretion system protein E [Gammaproteobacteria bacterium]
MKQAVDRQNSKLSVADIARRLEEDGVISANDKTGLLITDSVGGKQHPLITIARKQLKHKASGKTVNMDMLVDWLSGWARQPVYRIDPLKVDAHQVAEVMSFAFAQRHDILAVEVRPDYVTIVSAQPFYTAWEEDLHHVLKKEIRRAIADPEEISRFTVEFYQLARSVNQAAISEKSNRGQNFEQMMELGASGNHDANDQHIVKIVDWLLQYAYEQRASDIHIEPRREISQVRFRIDGHLHNVYELPFSVGLAVVSRLKILGRLNIAEKRKPQDGRIKTRNPNSQEVELRLSTLPTVFGEKLVMRIFDPEVLCRSFKDLGFSHEDENKWNHIVQAPHGIVLVTGPTGSGKTTTLYSSLKQLASPEVNICTIEDPIEMVEPAFNQMQVQSNIDVTFASGVKALLRQDPDIIMVGEIRDLETAEMATQAALTGHLVFSTLHTNDTASALTRLVELGVAPYIIRATLRGIMAQRLVRKLCPSCKQETTLSEDNWLSLTYPWKASPPKNPCKATGCLECRNTGFKGRLGLYEILTIDDSLKEMLSENMNLKEIRKFAVQNGMRSLRLSGAQKISSGLTTTEEVIRVTASGW